jgi:hypothetical protein
MEEHTGCREVSGAEEYEGRVVVLTRRPVVPGIG